MKQLFISYSRKDVDFARRLTESFAVKNFDAWVDWQDIPPSVNWMQQIQMGIEQADIFLFIVSPDSINSDVCSQEVAHAVQNGKRIIPVIARDFDPKTAPNSITHLNWIFFSESSGSYESAFEKLLTAVQTDYDWVQTHRRLQVKALEWSNGKNETSYLLRGLELEDAEAQLRVNGEKSPSPTQLQLDYIAKSRESENMHLEQQRAREQELQLEKNMGVRLRRLTYILLGIFTVVLLALYGWLYGLISNLAINAIKDQMIALVETSTAFIDGDAFETLVSSYGAADQSVYRDSYYSSLTRLLESIRANNSNITTRMTLYTVIKNGDDGVLVVASTLGELRFKSEFYPGGQGDIRVIGLQRTIADTNIVQDQNGSWISACTPILASTGKSTGALCTDFSADYLGEIRASVANTLLLTFLVVYPLMIGLIVFTTGSFRRSRKARS